MESYCRNCLESVSIEQRRLRGSFLDGLAFVVATVRAGLVRLLHFVAMRALAQGRLGQMIVGPPGACPPLGMSPFWIWHGTSPSLYFERVRWSLPASTHLTTRKTELRTKFYCFLSQSCLSRASGAIRGSMAWVSHRQSSWFKFTPQLAHSPRQSLLQMTFIGTESSTCSLSTSARNSPSP